MTQLVLPPTKLFKQDPQNRNYCWSDHYGALSIASKYCGAKMELDAPYKYFCWHHGCHGPWENVHPGILTYNSKNRKQKYFVGTKDQEVFLKGSGYSRVMAIGLPIIYVPKPSVKRLKGSLLIMPSHSLKGQKDFDDRAVKEYVDFVSLFIKDYSKVTVCVHHSCITNGLWINEFIALGLEIVEGARTDDENALSRQLHLFSQFETMTTNNWGSHVAYALYCDCKVSICGPHYEKSYSDALKDRTWARDEIALALFRSESVKSNRELFLKEFFTSPQQAVGNFQLGYYLVGGGNKVSDNEMKILFTSSFKERIIFSVVNTFKKALRALYRALK